MPISWGRPERVQSVERKISNNIKVGEKMTGTKNNSTADFLVTFFIGDCAVTRMLNDVVKNRESRLFAETLGFPEDFVVPFFQEEKDGKVIYTLRKNHTDKYESTIKDIPCDDHIIQSGDYITFKLKNGEPTLKALFVATSDIELDYKKYKIEKNTNIFIGRTPINDISFSFTDYVSREKHAVIRIDESGDAYIEDLKRSIGIYVNGQRTYSYKLNYYDEIYMMGLSIIYLGSYIAIRDLQVECGLPIMESFPLKSPKIEIKDAGYFVTTPRILRSLDNDEIEVDAPPNPPTMDKTPAILVIGPSLTMSMVMLASLGVSITSALSGGNLPTLIASITMVVGMLLGSLLWPSLLRSYQKRSIAKEEKHRKTRYTAYIADIEKQLMSRAERSAHILNDSLSPSPESLCSLLDNESRRLRLWERSYEDVDFLAVRLGTGSRPFDVSLKIPRQGFQLYEDEMRELPAALSKKYGMLSNVPLTLDIANNRTIGIIGSKGNINTILNEVILNIIALHSYDEVKLIFVIPSRQVQEFEIFKNVPHLWSNDKKVRYFATKPDEVHFVFNVVDEALRDRENTKMEDAIPIPHYVLIITEPSLVEKEALGRYTEDADNTVGLTTIFAYGDITRIPKSCKTIVQSDETRTGYYIKNKNANRFIPFTLDPLDRTNMANFVSKLSQLKIRRDQRSLGIVDSISFLQMYRAGNVSELNIEQHWDSNNSAKSLAAPIGVVAGGDIFSLDIHESYHGCHGLVAGTTGSGKSEFLQAFVLSLAINFSPKEVAFVLVDFKGGDMARPFMAKPFSPALPHLAATISNLSGNILYRALVSLEAEIKSRQRLFNESAATLGVDKLDINSYHKYFKGGRLSTPLPHLVIIIDEFAQLKTQQPDFLVQLINVAQVGRSLGIHLILATQKPGGIVDPQIMSNSRFKVCLKVADKQDSIDMINKPDSAMIKNPGRLFLQVGYDEIYECIQSGYSGADYIPTKTYMPDEEITVQMTDNTATVVHSAKIDLTGDKSDKTQLEAVVAEIVALGQKRNSYVKPLWLEMLAEKIELADLAKEQKGLCQATVGMVDYVRMQEQKTLTIDFTKIGHIALYGAGGTGKTTFLHTLVYSMVNAYGYEPDELNIYTLDFGGRNLGYLDTLPHSGGVVFADEEHKLAELVSILYDLIDERKRLFASSNCGTFTDYRAISQVTLPAILVLIDNYASFRDKYMDLADSLTEIISAGKTFGIYFVITGSTRNSIYYKVTEHISTYLILRMNDPNTYLDILNLRPPVTPENISGRGITVINREVVEFQIALATKGETEADRMSGVCANYLDIARSWNGYHPIHVGSDGENNDDSYDNASAVYAPLVYKNESPESIDDQIGTFIFGTSKSGALKYGISLSQYNKLCVCATDTPSMEGCYRNLFHRMSMYGDRKIILIDGENGAFKGLLEDFPSFRYINNSASMDAFIEDLRPILNARLEHEESRTYPLFIVVAEFNEFFSMITDEQATFMRKVFQYIDSPEYGIYFICGFNANGEKSNDRLYMSLVVNSQNYLICQNTYEKAISKIETLPTIHGVNASNRYVCIDGKVAEIRW